MAKKRYFIQGMTAELAGMSGVPNAREATHIGAVFATLDEKEAARLESIGYIVREVGKVRLVEITTPTPIEPSGALMNMSDVLETLGMESVWALTDPPLLGLWNNVAILDTGVRETHELVKDHIIYSKNFTDSPDGDAYDHGTGVASLIVIIAPESGIINFKVLNDEGEGSEEGIVMAIDEAIASLETDYPIRVLNMSFGSPDTGDYNNPVRVACRAAIERNIWIVAAAGNDGPEPGTITTPACEELVFAIGSVKFTPPEEITVSEFSSRGPTKEGLVKPDYVAIGENLLVASSESDAATIGRSGTSYAVPITTGQHLLHFQAMDLIAQTGEPLTWHETPEGIVPSYVGTVSIAEGMNYWGPRMSIKPSGVPQEVKDNDSGYGMIFAPLFTDIVQTVETGSGMAVFEMIIPIFMLGMMMPMMKGGFK